jgi:hypothetical protein
MSGLIDAATVVTTIIDYDDVRLLLVEPLLYTSSVVTINDLIL